IPFFIMASTFHLIDSLFVLMLANAAVGVPFATWLLKGFFDGIPRELEQAAMIDGCGHLTAFAYIIVPLARPGLAACAIYLAILTWSDFVFARTLINDQEIGRASCRERVEIEVGGGRGKKMGRWRQ